MDSLILTLTPLHPFLPSTPTIESSMVLPDVGEAADIDAGASASAAQPSQRITPYLSKVAARPGTTPKAHTPATGGKFAERQNAGSVVAALNAHLEVPAAAEAEEGDAMEVDGGAAAAARGGVEVEVLGAPLAPGAKYMVDRLEDRVRWAAGGAGWLAWVAARQAFPFVVVGCAGRMTGGWRWQRRLGNCCPYAMPGRLLLPPSTTDNLPALLTPFPPPPGTTQTGCVSGESHPGGRGGGGRRGAPHGRCGTAARAVCGSRGVRQRGRPP